jgi:RNA polymerase sigma-70 factor (ECF subfamily)
MKLSAWLHTIALNKARSHHRKRKWKMFVSIEDHDQPDEVPDLQESVASQEAVRNALAHIPRQYAEALLMQISSGLSCKEIAVSLGCSEGAVKVKLMRAREAFKRAYAHEEDRVHA